MSLLDTILAVGRLEDEWRARGMNPKYAGVKPEVHRKRDGLLLIHPNGRCEFLSFWQGIRHRLTGWLPPLDYRYSTAERQARP